MKTYDVTVTNGGVPFGPGIETVIRQKDHNRRLVVMDWPAAHLYIDGTFYSEAQIERMAKLLTEIYPCGHLWHSPVGKKKMIREAAREG